MVLTHLGLLSPMSDHRCWPLFAGSCLMDRHLFLLLAICFHWWAFFFTGGCSSPLVEGCSRGWGGCFGWWEFILVGGHLFWLVSVHFHWWGVVFDGGCSFLLVGAGSCWRAFIFILGHSFLLVGGRFHWWALVFIGGGSALLVGIHFDGEWLPDH